MKDINSTILAKGYVSIDVMDLNTGKIINHQKVNTVLNSGKSVLARCLANDLNSPFDFYISNMVFGTGGQNGDIPKSTDVGRTSLYNEVLSIGVSSSWDISAPTRTSFSGTISSSQGNNYVINEAGLVTESGDLFSMITFNGLSKTSQLQFTLNWNIVFA